MTPEEFERERLKSAEALNQVVEGARGALEVRAPQTVLGDPLRVETANPASESPAPPAWNPPTPPDLQPVNTSWTAGGPRPSGAVASLLDGSREKDREAQVRFNSDQVQLDNALVSWTADHFAATHKHYDAVLAQMQQRMDDIDARHRELERELVRHVHEMARRIDVVLGEGEKGRVSHEAALRSVRERLRALEERLR
jgi:hypothetical protein